MVEVEGSGTGEIMGGKMVIVEDSGVGNTKGGEMVKVEGSRVGDMRGGEMVMVEVSDGGEASGTIVVEAGEPKGELSPSCSDARDSWEGRLSLESSGEEQEL